ncbi:hypothetical protein Mapa_005091 [Marchantia paleacea]|nr:hypothetical protein Mapa_005091 [Marchantia paleacea]
MHMPISSAATSSNLYSGTSYMLTLVGGLFDSYLGANWTIALGATTFALGLGVLKFTVSYSGLPPEECIASATDVCDKAGFKYMLPFYLAMYTIALGVGAMRANVTAFGADQFDKNSKEEKKQSIHYYVRLYFTGNMGFLLGFLLGIYLMENVSYGSGYGFGLILFSVSAF